MNVLRAALGCCALIALATATLAASPASAMPRQPIVVAVVPANASLPLFATEVAAQSHCPKDEVVWLNTNSGIYHEKGMRWYGRTKHGTSFAEKKLTLRAIAIREMGNRPELLS